MSVTPTKRPYFKWDKSDGAEDFLQLCVPGGEVIGWIDPSGTLSGSLASGGGGTPGGSDGQIQFNDNGAFGGVSTANYDDTIGKLTFTANADNHTPLVVKAHSATQSVPLTVFEYSPVGTVAPASPFVFRGKGLGNFGGSPGIIQVIQNDDDAWPIVLQNELGPVGAFAGLYFDSAGGFSFNISPNGIDFAELSMTGNVINIAPIGPDKTVRPGTDNDTLLGDANFRWQTLNCGNSNLSVAAPTVAAGHVGFGGTVAAGANAGGGAPLPATVEGYLVINVAGTTRKVPYYAT